MYQPTVLTSMMRSWWKMTYFTFTSGIIGRAVNKMVDTNRAMRPENPAVVALNMSSRSTLKAVVIWKNILFLIASPSTLILVCKPALILTPFTTSSLQQLRPPPPPPPTSTPQDERKKQNSDSFCWLEEGRGRTHS